MGYVETSTELVAFAERLNKALDDIKFVEKGKGRQVELAKYVGLSQKAVRKWLEAEGMPTLEKCVVLAKLCNVSFEWLMTGRGPKDFDHPAESLLDSLPADLRGEALDFVRYKVERTMSGEQLGRYLRWLDQVIKDRNSKT